MNFCKRCGSKLRKESATKYVCADNQHEQYNNPKGAVAILLIDQAGKLIMTRRAHEPAKGKLDPIGGFLDYGENHEEALYRELAEETGLKPDDIAEVTYLGSAFDEYHWCGEKEPVASVYYTATLLADREPRAADDVASFESLALEDINRNELAWPGIGKMLDKFTENRNS